MSATDLLKEVESYGASVEARCEQLVVDMPVDFPEALIERLRRHKLEVIEHIRQQKTEQLRNRYDRV